MANYETILVQIEGTIATVTVNRPDKLNALNPTVLRELTAAFIQLDGSYSVRCAILTGAGDKAFVAGADIAEMTEMNAAQAKAFSDSVHRLGVLLESSPF